MACWPRQLLSKQRTIGRQDLPSTYLPPRPEGTGLPANRIGFDEGQIWIVPLCTTDAEYAHCDQLLARDELARADRFVTAELRRRFVVCRGTLRQLLGMTLDVPPQEIQFRYEQWGKPQLQDTTSSTASHALHFNVSHSADWALVGLACAPLGVDIEVPNARINYRAIASQVLSPSEKLVWDGMSAKERELAIMRLWVCKESILKAMGLGIAEGLTKISFALPFASSEFAAIHIDPSLQLHLDDDGSCRMTSWTDPETWRVQLVEAVEGANVAITTMRQIRRLSLNSWPCT